MTKLVGPYNLPNSAIIGEIEEGEWIETFEAFEETETSNEITDNEEIE